VGYSLKDVEEPISAGYYAMHHRFFIDEIDERTSRFEDGGVVKIPVKKITGYLAMTILSERRCASD
jgi:hypothetical protein